MRASLICDSAPFSCFAMFRPYSSVDLRSSKASSAKNTSAEFGLLVKPATDRPGNCTALCTPGIFMPMSADAPHDFFGAIQRRGGRQVDDVTRYCLSCTGMKPFGTIWNRPQVSDQQAGEHAHHQALVTEHAAHAFHVLRSGALEEPVEATEESAEHFVHAAGQRIGLRAVRLEQQGGQRRAQRQRVDRRDHGGDRDRQRELLVELAGQAGDERDRHEHGDEHQRDRDDRAADFLHGLVRRFARRQAVADVSLDVLDDHDRVVDHDADGEHQAEQRQRVDREAERQHQRERADDRHRHREQRNDRGAPGLQEHDHHDHDQRQRLEQRVRPRP